MTLNGRVDDAIARGAPTYEEFAQQMDKPKDDTALRAFYAELCKACPTPLDWEAYASEVLKTSPRDARWFEAYNVASNWVPKTS